MPISCQQRHDSTHASADVDTKRTDANTTTHQRKTIVSQQTEESRLKARGRNLWWGCRSAVSTISTPGQNSPARSSCRLEGLWICWTVTRTIQRNHKVFAFSISPGKKMQVFRCQRAGRRLRLQGSANQKAFRFDFTVRKKNTTRREVRPDINVRRFKWRRGCRQLQVRV